MSKLKPHRKWNILERIRNKSRKRKAHNIEIAAPKMESLEDRCLPAGNVLIDSIGLGTRITGDNESNAVALEVINESVVATG